MMLRDGNSYDATIVSAELSEAGTGTLQIAVKVDIDAGGEIVPMTGYVNLTGAGGNPPTEKAQRVSRAQIKALGFNPDTTDLTDENLAQLAGNQTKVAIKEEEYKGNKRLKIARFGGYTKPTVDKVAAAQAALRAAKSKTEPDEEWPELPDAPPELPPQRTPPDTKSFTKENAWYEFKKHCPTGWTPDDVLAEWSRITAELFPGKDIAQYTQSEWEVMMTKGMALLLPF